MVRQVAKFLGVNASLIVRCEEWFTVLFVIAKGFRPTFVSKKILKTSPEFYPGDVVFSDAGCCYEVVETRDNQVYCYPIDLTFYNQRRGNEQFVFPSRQLIMVTSSYPATQHLAQSELVTAQTISPLPTKAMKVKIGVGMNN